MPSRAIRVVAGARLPSRLRRITSPRRARPQRLSQPGHGFASPPRPPGALSCGGPASPSPGHLASAWPPRRARRAQATVRRSVATPALKAPGDAPTVPLGQKPPFAARATSHRLFQALGVWHGHGTRRGSPGPRREGVQGGVTPSLPSRSQVSAAPSEKPCQGQRDIYMTRVRPRRPAVTYRRGARGGCVPWARSLPPGTGRRLDVVQIKAAVTCSATSRHGPPP